MRAPLRMMVPAYTVGMMMFVLVLAIVESSTTQLEPILVGSSLILMDVQQASLMKRMPVQMALPLQWVGQAR